MSKKKRPIKKMIRGLKLWFNANYRKTKDSIVIIYTPGKVGSTSIKLSLKVSLPWLPVSHIHFLTPKKLDQFKQEGKWLNALTKAELANNTIEANKEKRIKIITLMRDPIARDLSGIFQSLDEHFPNKEAEQVTPNDCIGLLNDSDFSYTSSWFDEELKEYLNFDIYQHSFDKKRGYQIYHEEKFDLLCIKLEQLSQVYTEAISDFLNIKGDQLKNENTGSSKPAADIYRETKQAFKLPEKDLRNIYNDKLLHTFYTKEEVERFIQQWQA